MPGLSQTAVAPIGRAGAIEQSDGFKLLRRPRPGLVAWLQLGTAFAGGVVITRDVTVACGRMAV
jgi:hypothetical protein